MGSPHISILHASITVSPALVLAHSSFEALYTVLAAFRQRLNPRGHTLTSRNKSSLSRAHDSARPSSCARGLAGTRTVRSRHQKCLRGGAEYLRDAGHSRAGTCFGRALRRAGQGQPTDRHERRRNDLEAEMSELAEVGESDHISQGFADVNDQPRAAPSWEPYVTALFAILM